MTSTFRVNKGGGVSASSLPPKASSSSTPASECPVSLPLPPLLRQTSYVALTGDAYSPLGLDRSIRCHGTENNGMSGGRMLWGEAASSHPPPVVPRCALWCQARVSLSLSRASWDKTYTHSCWLAALGSGRLNVLPIACCWHFGMWNVLHKAVLHVSFS